MNRKNWLPFIFLNILVSAVTTLTVLVLWNKTHPPQEIVIEVPGAANTQNDPQTAEPLDPANLPPLDVELVEIQGVIASGDLQNEFVIVKKLGEDVLDLTGWYLMSESSDQFVFPEFQILQGQVDVYTRGGTNSVNKLFWGQSEAMWHSGDTVVLFDFAGQERAVYQIP